MGTPVAKQDVIDRPLTLFGHTELALAALATLQCHSINPTFTSSSDDAGRPGQSQGMEDEACTASGATSEAVG